MMMPRTDTGPPVGTADNANIAVFEGQRAVVTVLTVMGAVLDGAEVTSDDTALRVIEHVCAGPRCGVLLAVDDVEPDVGRAIPAPIDASNLFLRIRLAGQPDRRALFSVAPLDAIRNDGEATIRGTYFAASVTTSAATAFRGAPGLEPIRWFVFGDAVLRGSVDVSGMAATAGPGGEPGAMASAMGEGDGAGGAGSASGGGGGGGGSLEPGSAGEGTDAGEGGAAFALGCGIDPFIRDCGGGAGGGAYGTGGGGGGTFAIAILGTVDADIDIVARGGDGDEGGGGGGGGRVFVAATAPTGAGVRADVAGGAGGPRPEASGGAGGAGEARLPGDGPTIDTPASWIVRDPSVTVSGRATAGASIEVSLLDDTVVATATVATDGTFSLPVALAPGLNRLRVIEVDGEVRRRSWSGNHFELERRGAEVLPVGALLDVAHVP